MQRTARDIIMKAQRQPCLSNLPQRLMLHRLQPCAEDMRRFQEEAVSYELRNPGWFQAWLTKQGGQVGSKAGQKSRRSGRPRPPLTAWMAFVQATLAKLKENHPEAVAGIKQMELMVGAAKRSIFLKVHIYDLWLNTALADRMLHCLRETACHTVAQRCSATVHCALALQQRLLGLLAR